MVVGITPAGRSVHVLRTDPRWNHMEIRAQSNTMTSGSLLHFDSGNLRSPLGQDRVIDDILIEGTFNNLATDAADYLYVGSLFQLLSTFNVYINNTLTFTLPSTGVDDNAWYAFRNAYVNDSASSDELQNAYSEDDIDVFANATTQDTDTMTQIGDGESRAFSHSLCRVVLSDLLKGLPLSAVNSVRIELGLPAALSGAGVRRLNYSVTAPMTIENALSITDMKVKFRFLDTPAGMGTRIPPSIACIWPRWCSRRYVRPLAASLTTSVNITQDFPTLAQVSRIYLEWTPSSTESTTSSAQPVVANTGLLELITSLVIKENGTETENYTSAKQIKRAMTRAQDYTRSHPLVPMLPENGFLTSGFYIDMNCLHRHLLTHKGHRSVKLIGGKSNRASTLELTLGTASSTPYAAHDLLIHLFQDAHASLNTATGEVFVD